MNAKEKSFTTKLNHLFREEGRPDESRYTQTKAVEIANGILSRVNLWKLRKGIATNLGLHVI